MKYTLFFLFLINQNLESQGSNSDSDSDSNYGEIDTDESVDEIFEDEQEYVMNLLCYFYIISMLI